MSEPLDIAIIGMAGAYAGAYNAGKYWQNILNKVDSVEDAGLEWAGPYLDPNAKGVADRIYTMRGGFLKNNNELDIAGLGVMPNTLDGGEPDNMLALCFARHALNDSGYMSKPFNREKVGIVLGRGTYANRGHVTMMQHSMVLDQTIELVAGLRPDLSPEELLALKSALKKQLPVYNAEMVGLQTPNIVTGLIANRLDLMGPNYIIDAACASTLIAVELAVRELQSGRCDMVITGGVQAQVPPQIYMQFCQINALSRGQLRPFQKGSDGTLLGEGVGLIVLKPLAKAEADGDRIYAVIKGIGSASDGKAKGLLTPRLEGEILAVKRAYESSGIDPTTVGLIEAHGTGTKVGDRTEIESLTAMFGPRSSGMPDIALGSVKSMISHCLPASGSASIIKVALALHHKVLPPMLCEEVDPDLGLDRTPFYINNEARPWIHGGPHPRRAGVNAFGFGGINAHIILEEYRPSTNNTARRTSMSMLHSPGPSELLTLAANSASELTVLAQQLLEHARGPSRPLLSMLAKASSALASGGEHRLAIVASSALDLIAKLDQAISKLSRPDVAPFKIRSGVHYGHGPAPGRVCFLFPGEGAQYANMMADICLNFPQAREWFDFIEETAVRRGAPSRAQVLFPAPTGLTAADSEQLDRELYGMEVGASAVFAASMAMYEILDDLGLRPDAMLGHSTGENTALTASGVRRFTTREEIADSQLEITRLYRELDAAGKVAEGSLLTIGALKPESRSRMLAQFGALDSAIKVAMDNCPNQLVLFGSRDDIAVLKEQLSAEGAICAELPFGRAYHTALYRPVAEAYGKYYKTLDMGSGRTVLYSAHSVGPFPKAPEDIRQLAAAQWENPVRFTETIEKLYEDGVRVFLEVGPSGNLTSFVGDTLRDRSDVIALSSNSRRKSGISHLHQTLAQLFAAGVSMRPQGLYAHREIRDLNLSAPPLPAPAIKPRLNLQMPLLHLPEAFKQAALLRPPVDVRAAAVDETADVHPKVVRLEAHRTAEPRPAALPVVAPLPADPRLDALKNHFQLMQEFLDSQARVLAGFAPGGTLPSTLSTPPALHEAALPATETTLDDGPLDPERYPLLGRITERTDRKLVSERTYNSDVDIYLQDHAIGSRPTDRRPSLLPLTVVPFTFSMEICAEAANLLCGEALKVIGVDNARGHRWLGLDRGNLSVRIVAERAAGTSPGTDRVAVRIFQLNSAGPMPYALVYECTVLLAAKYPDAPAPRPWTSTQDSPPIANPDDQLYSLGMFHGPRLQGVKSVRRWSDEAIEAEMITIPRHDYFTFTTNPVFRTDATMLDSASQTVGYWLTEKFNWGFNCFPFHLGHFTQYADPLPGGTKVICRGDIRMSDRYRIEAHLDVFDESGRLIMRAANWEDRKFEVPQHFLDVRNHPQTAYLSSLWLQNELESSGASARRLPPFDEGFLDEGWEVWKRVLANLVLSTEERHVFYNELPSTGPRREEWLTGRCTAKDAIRDWAQKTHGLRLAPADIVVLSNALGEPVIVRIDGLTPGLALPVVSISRSRGYSVAVCVDATQRIGIDYQHLEVVDVEDLIAAAFSAEEAGSFLRSRPAAELKRAAVAYGCAKAAAAKAAGTGLQSQPKDWQVISANLMPGEVRSIVVVRHRGLEYRVDLRINDSEVFALCRAAPETAALPVVAQAG